MGELKPRGEELWCAAAGMRALQGLAQGMCRVLGPPSHAAASLWASAALGGLWLGEGKEGWCQCPHWDGGGMEGLCQGANYVKGYRVLPQAEDPSDQALNKLCSKGALGGVCVCGFWAEDPAWAKTQRPEYRMYLMWPERGCLG